MSLKVSGKAYGWNDVGIKLPGLTPEVQEVSYNDRSDIGEIYGRGDRPRGYDGGNHRASGKLTMLRDGYEELLNYCEPGGVAFYKLGLASVMVSYANEGEKTHIDELKKVRFTKRGNKAAQDDKSLTVDLDVIILGGTVQDGVEPI